ncbi:MAG: MFS transporter [Proteobacteria bacterium]|nr:MFS transporter [Pseudomonadota bacterium]
MNGSKPAEFYGWTNAVLLFGIYFVGLGLIFYGFSPIFPAMIEATGWGRGEAALAQTFNALLMGFLAPLAAWVINRHGPRKTIGFGLLVMTAALLLVGTVVDRLWQWTLVWGFMMPVGFAFAGMLPVQTTINFWFSARRATVMGLVMTGAALGGFLAQPVFTWLIHAAGSWRAGWLAASGFVLSGLVCCLLWLRDRPEDYGQHPDGRPPREKDAPPDPKAAPSRTYRTDQFWPLKEALRTRALYYIMVIFIAQMMPVFLMTTHGVLHLLDHEFSPMQAASILSLILLGSGLARFPMGWLGDRVEPRRIVMAVLVLRLAAFAGLWQAPNMTVLAVCGLVFGFSYGTTIVMIPTLTANLYGPASFAALNGFLAPVIIIFGASVPVGAGYIADFYGRYDPVFIALLGVIAIAFICAWRLKPPVKPTPDGPPPA